MFRLRNGNPLLSGTNDRFGPSPIVLAILLWSFLLSLASIILMIDTNLGDPSIALVYAKNMWRYGFMSYNSLGPSTGATSPLWVMILSTFYLLGEFFLGMKILAVGIFFVGSFLFYYYTKSLTWSANAAVLACATWNIIRPGHLYSILLFETTLAAVLVTIGFLLSMKAAPGRRRDLIALGLALGLLPLARPELVLGAIILFFGFVMRTSPAERLHSAFIILGTSLVCAGPYYLWALIATGDVLPQSGRSRLAYANAEPGLWHSNFSVSALEALVHPGYLPLTCLALLGLGLWIFGKFDRQDRPALIMAAVMIATYLLFFSAVFPARSLSDAQRYLFPPLIPGLITFSAYGLRAASRIFFWKPRPIVILTVCLASVYSFAILKAALRHPRYSISEIFQRDLAAELNNLRTDGRVLIYEAQTQYDLDNPILSLDGVVGGEALPYLASKSDLTDFILDYRPVYFVSDDSILSRKELKHSVL